MEQQEQMITLDVKRVYVTDLSLEMPHAPQVFLDELKPNMQQGFSIETSKLDEENHYLIKLRMTLTVKDGDTDRVIYLVEATQNGIFEIAGLDDEQLQHALNVYAPSLLYPYVREVISNASNRTTFPPVYLPPINFDIVYRQRLQHEEQNK